VVLVGRSIVKIEASIGKCERSELAANEIRNHPIKIEKRNGVYFWSSQENRKLHRHFTNAIELFVAVDGYGSIRIMREGDALAFHETITVGMDTVIYYGITTTL